MNGFNQLSKSMSNILGANQLILEQIQKYILEKYPSLQNKLGLIKDKLRELQERVLSRNSEKSDNIGGNSNEISSLLTKPLVRDDLLEVTMPGLGVAKNRSERKMAELNHDLRNEFHQPSEVTNTSKIQQPLENSIKVIPHNSWHYSTLNDCNNSNLPKPIIKRNIIRIVRDNEMKLRDPSGQHRNFSSWKEKVQARIEDKIINEIQERNLVLKESWMKMSEKKKMLYKLLEKSDYFPRKQVNEILYGDLAGRVFRQQCFSRKGGQRYLATSSENPPSQISFGNKRGKVGKNVSREY
jgi:hypothetical protein